MRLAFRQTHLYRFVNMEVTPRFELGSEGFADPCLTTWLCHHFCSKYKDIEQFYWGFTIILYHVFLNKSTNPHLIFQRKPGAGMDYAPAPKRGCLKPQAT